MRLIGVFNKKFNRNYKIKTDVIERPPLQNKFCGNCGSAVKEKMVYCTNCGDRLILDKAQDLVHELNTLSQGLKVRNKVKIIFLLCLIYFEIILGTFFYFYIRLHGWESLPFLGNFF